MAKLKKCPFCGGESKLNYVGTCIPLYFISCEECGCKQESSIHKEAVINAWNNRVTEADIRANAIEEFAEKLRIKFRDIGAFTGYEVKREIDELAEQLKGE